MTLWTARVNVHHIHNSSDRTRTRKKLQNKNRQNSLFVVVVLATIVINNISSSCCCIAQCRAVMAAIFYGVRTSNQRNKFSFEEMREKRPQININEIEFIRRFFSFFHYYTLSPPLSHSPLSPTRPLLHIFSSRIYIVVFYLVLFCILIKSAA